MTSDTSDSHILDKEDNSQSESEGNSFLCLEDLDPVDAAFQREVETSTVCPIISQSSLKLIPISYATDGMSLKPGLQFDSRLKELVGLLFPVNLAYVQAHPKPDSHMLKKSFVMEADAVVLTTLDEKLSLPVGNSFKGKNLTGESVFEKIYVAVPAEIVLKGKVFVTTALLLVRGFMKESLELVTHVSRLAPSVRNFLSLLVVAVTVKMNRVPKMASILEIKGDIWVSSKIGRLK
ncbi:unnamed protein product, partial [Porites evermanni]